ncbi:MAG TPA: class I SAM-dependent methyltransferase [Rubrivivax sp.]|nr:class I SAM-dependent methyltransferase [Rubrivivax sp.]
MKPPLTSTSNPPASLRPHAPLTEYYADEAERLGFIRKIFDDTASDYDRIERVLAFGSGSWYRRQALQRAGLAQGMHVLDVGFGTGLVAREALAVIGPQGRLVGVDPSPGMMNEAQLPAVELVTGIAEQIPRPDASSDFVSMGYALRHIADVAAAFGEFHRVLKPGGRLLVLEITKPAGTLPRALLKAYMRAVVPTIARIVGRRRDTAHLWRYYWDTIEACIEPESLMSALRTAGFTQVKRGVSLGIFSEYTALKP